MRQIVKILHQNERIGTLKGSLSDCMSVRGDFQEGKRKYFNTQSNTHAAHFYENAAVIAGLKIQHYFKILIPEGLDVSN